MRVAGTVMRQINGKVKLLKDEGKAEDVKEGVEQDPEAEVAIGCPLCGAMFDLRTGEKSCGLSLHSSSLMYDSLRSVDRFCLCTVS